MKTLTLIRHATANNKLVSQQDSERTLSEWGHIQAENIAKQLQLRNSLPDYLLCSPTRRTLQTATILCQTLKLDPYLLQTDNVLYSGDVEKILSRLCGLTTEQHVFVVGHNPNMTELAHRLCHATKTIILPPAGVISLEFAMENWQDLANIPGKLLFFIESHEPS
jgi:phosphohistidine phosphatase